MGIQFDAIAYAQELETAGVPRLQAEVHAKTLGQVLSDCVAVPADLAVLKRELEDHVSRVEIRLRAEISKTESRLLSEISQTESRLHSEIIGVESRLRTEIAELRSELRAGLSLMKWMNALTLALLVGMLVKLLPA
jgi:chaperonin cofactor prefoldin